MKARQYINMVGMTAAVLLSSCVKDTLYDTPHPDYGKIAVTADWSACGEGINIPATWTVTMGDYTGTEQLLTAEIRYADGNPSPTTLKSDLTEALKEFNTRKGKSLTLGGTLVETPEGMEVDGAEINGWEEVKGDDVNADL